MQSPLKHLFINVYFHPEELSLMIFQPDKDLICVTIRFMFMIKAFFFFCDNSQDLNHHGKIHGN